MSTQNLVSASITPETKQDVMAKILSIQTSLNFLLTLKAEEITSLFKPGNNYAPFVELAFNTANSHPEIMSRVFDIDEFKKDYLIYKDLSLICGQVNELAKGLNNTLTAASSDTLIGALEVYDAVKKNQSKVAGLNAVAEEMAPFFKKSKKKGDKTS
ncbi:MAG: hypothetical protein V1874_02385 [Spirochaetota bacterium]